MFVMLKWTKILSFAQSEENRCVPCGRRTIQLLWSRSTCYPMPTWGCQQYSSAWHNIWYTERGWLSGRHVRLFQAGFTFTRCHISDMYTSTAGMTKQRKLIVIKLYSRIVRSAFVFVIVCHSSTSFNLQFILSVKKMHSHWDLNLALCTCMGNGSNSSCCCLFPGFQFDNNEIPSHLHRQLILGISRRPWWCITWLSDN